MKQLPGKNGPLSMTVYRPRADSTNAFQEQVDRMRSLCGLPICAPHSLQLLTTPIDAEDRDLIEEALDRPLRYYKSKDVTRPKRIQINGLRRSDMTAIGLIREINPNHILNTVDVCFNYPASDHNARRVSAFVNQYKYQFWHGQRVACIVNGVLYAHVNRWTSRNDLAYPKLIGGDSFFHFEVRYKEIPTIRKYLHILRAEDIFDISFTDYLAAFQREVHLARINVERAEQGLLDTAMRTLRARGHRISKSATAHLIQQQKETICRAINIIKGPSATPETLWQLPTQKLMEAKHLISRKWFDYADMHEWRPLRFAQPFVSLDPISRGTQPYPFRKAPDSSRPLLA